VAETQKFAMGGNTLAPPLAIIHNPSCI